MIFEASTIFSSVRVVGISIHSVAMTVTAIRAFIAQSLLLTLADLGSYEADIFGTIALFGVPEDPATALALVDHFGRILLVLIVGICTAHIGFQLRAYFRNSVNNRMLAKSESDDES
ncbi:hypothetical protein U4E84_03910 [Halorubrum sp. AD140]|uniref:hypothetical protein n=1 Tax=Halorubrum sp. AD140 TaxID=3050073 RepID=UPI002ACCD303|nr:hypothetical protein [Halorubrum sp. AD140]MDZ5810497.1 hypothetical protein [Halorubrum sp. AD140]